MFNLFFFFNNLSNILGSVKTTGRQCQERGHYIQKKEKKKKKNNDFKMYTLKIQVASRPLAAIVERITGEISKNSLVSKNSNNRTV